MMIYLLIMLIFHSYEKLPTAKMLFVENLFQLSRDDDSRPASGLLSLGKTSRARGHKTHNVVVSKENLLLLAALGSEIGPGTCHPIAASKQPSESNLPESNLLNKLSWK